MGGNFAINVIGEVLLSLNHNITHISSSKKDFKHYHLLDKNIFIIAIPPAKNLSFFVNALTNKNIKVFIEKPFSFNFLASFKFLFTQLKINHEKVLNYEFEWNTQTKQKNFKNNWKHLSPLGGGGLYNYISHIISVLIINFNDVSIVDAKLCNKHLDN